MNLTLLPDALASVIFTFLPALTSFHTFALLTRRCRALVQSKSWWIPRPLDGFIGEGSEVERWKTLLGCPFTSLSIINWSNELVPFLVKMNSLKKIHIGNLNDELSPEAQKLPICSIGCAYCGADTLQFESLHLLRKITLKFNSDAEIARLSHLPLKTLKLIGCRISLSTLHHWKSSLERLHLSGYYQKEQTFSFRQFEKLKHLSLARVRFSDLKYLSGTLTGLTIHENRQSLNSLRHLDSLTELHLNSFAAPRTPLTWLGPLRALKKLTLDCFILEDFHLEPLHALPALTHLSLRSSRLRGEGFSFLPVSLVSLHVNDLPMLTLQTLGLLIKLPCLQSLSLVGCKTVKTCVNKGPLFSIATLTELNLFGSTGITDAWMKVLSPLMPLQSVNLCDTNVTEKCLPWLAQFKSLKKVAFTSDDIQDSALLLLKDLPLQEINLSCGGNFSYIGHSLCPLALKKGRIRHL